MGVKRALVVYGQDRLDEISMSAPTTCVEVRNGTFERYVITPEQFSFTAEQKLMEAIDTKAVMNAEVITLSRMAYRVLGEVGGNNKSSLSKCGKAMLIYSILNQYKSELKFLGKSDENIDLSMRAITEFKKT